MSQFLVDNLIWRLFGCGEIQPIIHEGDFNNCKLLVLCDQVSKFPVLRTFAEYFKIEKVCFVACEGLLTQHIEELINVASPKVVILSGDVYKPNVKVKIIKTECPVENKLNKKILEGIEKQWKITMKSL
jgi:hypothetical protein